MTFTTVEVEPTSQPIPELKTWAPTPPPGARTLQPDTVAVCDGEPVLAYLSGFDRHATRLINTIETDPPGDTWAAGTKNHARLSGVVVSHRVFGWTPPVVVRRRWGGSIATLHHDRPAIIDCLTDYAPEAETAFAAACPAAHQHTVEAVNARIPPRWRFANTTWTSGIINNTTAHPYHRDSGNIAKSWSAMLTARRWCEGGWLHIATYDVWLPVDHGTLTLFDGHQFMHGVSPLDRLSPRACRYSVVMYAKAGLHVVDPDPAREPLRAAKAATLNDVTAQLDNRDG